MFAKLENVLKAEVLDIRTDLGNLLKRVEMVEEVTEQHTLKIEDLKKSSQESSDRSAGVAPKIGGTGKSK